MRLYRNGYYAKAFFGWLLAALLLGYQGVVIIRALIIGITANWRHFTLLTPSLIFGVFFIGILLLLNIFFVTKPLSYLINERRLLAAEQQNPLITPLVKFQPQPELALRDGETLKLERVRSLGSTIRSLLGSFAVAVILMATGETLIIGLLPSLAQSALNPFNDLLSYFLALGPAPSLTEISPLDWASVALPLIMTGWFVIVILLEIVRSQRDTLIADDRGVTRIRSGQTRQFIPWSDVAVFLRGVDNTSDAPQGGYFIWGQSHGVNFQITGAPVALPEAQALHREQAQGYHFIGGVEAYQQDARRLLATISARSYHPMTYWTGSTRVLAGIRRRFPIAGLTTEGALTLPQAVVSLQPSETAVNSARRNPAPFFKLAARFQIYWPSFVAEFFCYFCVLGALGYLGGSSSSSLLSPASIASGDPLSLITIAIIVPFITTYSVLFALARRQMRLPSVTVSATGLKGSASGSLYQKAQEIPWAEIRAWAIIPTAKTRGKRPTTYIVLADDKKITWVEPEHARLAGRGVQGDREAAFRERATELHALIVAKTGLPLRDASQAPDDEPSASAAQLADSWETSR